MSEAIVRSLNIFEPGASSHMGHRGHFRPFHHYGSGTLHALQNRLFYYLDFAHFHADLNFSRFNFND